MFRLATLIALALAVGVLFVTRAHFLTSMSHAEAAAPGTIGVSLHDDQGNQDDQDDSTLVGALANAGYHPSVDEIVALSDAGVDPDLVTAIGESDVVRPSVPDLIALANAGVDASELRDYARLDAALSARDMIALAHHGIDAGDVDDLRTAGYRPDSIDDLIALHDAGVDGDYVRALRRHGYRDLSVDQLIRLHNAGVDV